MAYQARPIYMLRPHVAHRAVEEAIKGFLNNLWLPKHSFSDSLSLYHYTDFSGLRGILRTRSFWFGHSTSFNDPSEIQYGRELISGMLLSLLKDENREDIRAFLKQMSVNVNAFGKGMLHVFAASLCESGNLLSQWQSYADRGGGYCLGMSLSDSTMTASDPADLDRSKRPLCLRKVIYNPNEQRQLVSSYLAGVVEAAKESLEPTMMVDSSPQTRAMPLQMAALPSNILFEMLFSFKHPAFESEQEWRMIRVTLENHEPEHILFRETQRGVVPYRQTVIFENDGDNSQCFPIRAIGFGPSLDPTRTTAALELLVAHLAAANHPVKMPPTVQIEEPGFSLR